MRLKYLGLLRFLGRLASEALTAPTVVPPAEPATRDSSVQATAAADLPTFLRAQLPTAMPRHCSSWSIEISDIRAVGERRWGRSAHGAHGWKL